MSARDDAISIVLHESDDPMARIPRATVRDESLGWRALGMLLYMVSLPRDWVFRLSHLSKRRDGHGNGRYATRAALGELEDAGYLEIVKIRDARGRIVGVEWHISKSPIFQLKQQSSPGSDYPTLDSPTLDNPPLDNPPLDNPTLRYTDLTGERNEAAAGKTLEAPSPSAAAAPMKSTNPATPNLTPCRRRGDEQILHGIEVWTTQDAAVVEKLVSRYGAEVVEAAAAATPPARGHAAPYPSAVATALQDRTQQQERAAAAAAAAATPPPPPGLDGDAARARLAAAKAAAGLGVAGVQS